MVKIIILSREGDIIFEEVNQKTLNELLKNTDSQYINQDLEILYTLNKQDYQSPLYKLDITQTTENRMINFRNVINFLEVNKEYYKRINNLLILGNYTPNLLV